MIHSKSSGIRSRSIAKINFKSAEGFYVYNMRRRIFLRNNYYHVYNRRPDGELLFFNPGNYIHCLRLVKRYYKKCNVSIIAYCLMPNHYHFLLRQETDQSLSKFINTAFNAYVQAVNRQQQRKGTLFEGRFKSVHVDRDAYLMHVCRYIHLNPVEAKLVDHPSKWAYSNYLEWINQRKGTLIDEQFIRDYFLTPDAYKQFVDDYRGYNHSQKLLGPYVWD